ncbi:MAG: type II secretion system protein [Clostridiaceae bacterium]|nr:type II secretion system protein [Clostridiaceae bacterium]
MGKRISKEGFTLLELVVSLGFLMTILVAFLSLFLFISQNTTINKVEHQLNMLITNEIETFRGMKYDDIIELYRKTSNNQTGSIDSGLLQNYRIENGVLIKETMEKYLIQTYISFIVDDMIPVEDSAGYNPWSRHTYSYFNVRTIVTHTSFGRSLERETFIADENRREILEGGNLLVEFQDGWDLSPLSVPGIKVDLLDEEDKLIMTQYTDGRSGNILFAEIPISEDEDSESYRVKIFPENYGLMLDPKQDGMNWNVTIENYKTSIFPTDGSKLRLQPPSLLKITFRDWLEAEEPLILLSGIDAQLVTRHEPRLTFPNVSKLINGNEITLKNIWPMGGAEDGGYGLRILVEYIVVEEEEEALKTMEYIVDGENNSEVWNGRFSYSRESKVLNISLKELTPANTWWE